MATSQGHFKCIDHKPINLIKCLQELDSSYVKFSFLNIDTYQWQGFKVIIILININLLKNYKFQLFAAAIFFLCFWNASGLSFLLSSNYQFNSKLLYFKPGGNFHVIEIFFNSLYRVEVSTRDENVHIISPLE